MKLAQENPESWASRQTYGVLGELCAAEERWAEAEAAWRKWLEICRRKAPETEEHAGLASRVVTHSRCVVDDVKAAVAAA